MALRIALPQHLAVVSLGPHSNFANNFLASACDSRRPVAGPYQFVMTDGSDEQLFGAIWQVFGRRRRHL